MKTNYKIMNFIKNLMKSNDKKYYRPAISLNYNDVLLALNNGMLFSVNRSNPSGGHIITHLPYNDINHILQVILVDHGEVLYALLDNGSILYSYHFEYSIKKPPKNKKFIQISATGGLCIGIIDDGTAELWSPKGEDLLKYFKHDIPNTDKLIQCCILDDTFTYLSENGNISIRDIINSNNYDLKINNVIQISLSYNKIVGLLENGDIFICFYGKWGEEHIKKYGTHQIIKQAPIDKQFIQATTYCDAIYGLLNDGTVILWYEYTETIIKLNKKIKQIADTCNKHELVGLFDDATAFWYHTEQQLLKPITIPLQFVLN